MTDSVPDGTSQSTSKSALTVLFLVTMIDMIGFGIVLSAKINHKQMIA